jgi:hypothetical protein
MVTNINKATVIAATIIRDNLILINSLRIEPDKTIKKHPSEKLNSFEGGSRVNLKMNAIASKINPTNKRRLEIN